MKQPNTILYLQEPHLNKHYQFPYLKHYTIFTPQLLYSKVGILIPNTTSLWPTEIFSCGDTVMGVRLFPRNSRPISIISIYSDSSMLDIAWEVAPFLPRLENTLYLGDFNVYHPLRYGDYLLPTNTYRMCLLLYMEKTEEMLDHLQERHLPILNKPGIPIFFHHNSLHPIVIDLAFASSYLVEKSYLTYDNKLHSDYRYIQVDIEITYPDHLLQFRA